MSERRGPPGRSRVSRALVVAVVLAGAAGCGRSALEPPRKTYQQRPPPPPPPPPRVLMRFAVIGDYGNDSDNEARVARMVSGWSPDFVITTGDNNYPSGAASTVDANIGKHYGSFIGDYRGTYGTGSATNRFWPSPGNHDWDTGSLAPYLDYFTLPGNGRYYDVVVGPVHLFALDSDPREPDGVTEDSKQARWLKSALSSSISCFDVVYFHHPGYSSGPHGSALNMRWPFEGWGADMVFAGHDHVYERAKVGGIRHVTVGVSGAESYSFGAPIAESEARVSGRYGAVAATAREDGLSIQFFADDGSEMDAYTLHKPCR